MNQQPETSNNRTLTVIALVTLAILFGFSYGRLLLPYLIAFVVVMGIGTVIWAVLTAEPGDRISGPWPLEDLDTHLPLNSGNDVLRDDRIAIRHDSRVA